MSQYYPDDFLRMLRNDIPIDEVIVDLLNLEVQKDRKTIRFRCPLCYNFHTATNHKTNCQMLRLPEKLQSDRYSYHRG